MAHQLCEPAKLLPTEVAQPIPRQDLQGGLYLVEIFPNFCGVGLEHDGTEQLSFETQSSAPAPKRLKLGSAPELFLLQCLGDNSNATASNRCFNKAASICLPECFLKGLDRRPESTASVQGSALRLPQEAASKLYAGCKDAVGSLRGSQHPVQECRHRRWQHAEPSPSPSSIYRRCRS